MDFEDYRETACWMRLQWDRVGPSALNNIRMPGSHDAGSYRTASLVGRPWVKTQSLCVLEQLFVGSRFLDLRVKEHKGEFFIHHGGWICVELKEVRVCSLKGRASMQ